MDMDLHFYTAEHFDLVLSETVFSTRQAQEQHFEEICTEKQENQSICM